MQDIYNGISAAQLEGATWRKSQRSNSQGACVELARLDGATVAMRSVAPSTCSSRKNSASVRIRARNCTQMPAWARRWTRFENASRFIDEIL